jgi:hypothetical protein
MLLAQLNFPIDYDSFHQYLVANVPNADGLCSCDTGYNVIEKNPFTSTDITNVNTYYNSLTQAGEAAKMSPTTQQIIQNSILSAQTFGNNLLLEYAAQNVLAGITQAGQTIPVSDYLANLYNYLSAGSLYASIQEINNLIADTSSTKTNLSPFLTNDIMYTYMNKIQAYLGITQTPNPGS